MNHTSWVFGAKLHSVGFAIEDVWKWVTEWVLVVQFRWRTNILDTDPGPDIGPFNSSFPCIFMKPLAAI